MVGQTQDLRPLVDLVCTRDDVARVKPAPDRFLLGRSDARGAGGLSGVEDSPDGMRSARAAGMVVVAVPNRPTAGPPLSDPDLVLASLDAMSLQPRLESFARHVFRGRGKKVEARRLMSVAILEASAWHNSRR